jgi:putative tricarboxylic transport membrane protein
MSNLVEALSIVMSMEVLLIVFASAVYGLFMGAMPGLSATMAVALLVPLTFFMDPIPAMAAIITTSAMAIFAGDIPAALIRMPGTPSSAAYVDDLYGLTLEGKAQYGLGACVVFSAIGGIFGTVVLMVFAPLLAQFAASFSSDEYFWLACLGMTCAVTIFAASPVKGVIALCIGLLATVGADLSMSYPRYTFGSYGLLSGISFIPALVGIFAMAEIMKFAKERRTQIAPPVQVIASIFSATWEMIRTYWVQATRGSLVGTLIGFLPGAGGGISTWVSYAIALRFSKRDPVTGKHDPMVGIVEAGAANNSGLAGSWIPTLVFAIPGDALTAIVLGVLLLKGVVPGPAIFTDSATLVYAILMLFVLANILMVPLGWAAIRTASYALRMPRPMLMSLVLLLAIVGSYAINNSLFDVWVMLVLGIVAFFLQENDFPVAPIILGLVIGPIVEQNLLMSLLKSRGDVMGLLDRPVAVTLGAITMLIWVAAIGQVAWGALQKRRATDTPA